MTLGTNMSGGKRRKHIDIEVCRSKVKVALSIHIIATRLSHLWYVTDLFAMLRDIDLICGMWLYNDKIQIKFMFRSGPMIFGRVMALGL